MKKDNGERNVESNSKENKGKKSNRAGSNGKNRDVSSKNVFHNPVLCAQFLRDNVNIPILKNVQPEDIEDVSERYRPYLGNEFETDTVKKIRLHDEERKAESTPLFLISLIEHKSAVDYNVSMQLLKYMMCIWLEYGKEIEQKKPGITGRKSFRYPTIIPVVYYEGKAAWTADRHFRSRVSRNEMLKNWIPDFTYEVVRLHDYSDEELLDRRNEMSLIMLFNKIQDAVDLSEFLKIPGERLNQMIRDTPEAIVDIIVSVMESLCTKVGATVEETEECVQKVKECKMGYLFENMEKMDIQAERKNTQEALKKLEEAEKKAKEAEKKAKEAEKKAKEAEKKAKEAEKKKEEVLENVIKIFIEGFQEMGISKEITLSKVIEKFANDFTAKTQAEIRAEAESKINKYWK